jgi:hypothetical protein
LYKVHASVGCDRCGGGANDTELQPESTCANRDGLACDLLALLGAPKDINEVDPFASRK